MQSLEHLSVKDIFEDVEIGAYAQAQARDISFEITTVERSTVVEADWQILSAAVANLHRTRSTSQVRTAAWC